MIKSISEYLWIPKIENNKLIGKEYGLVKSSFIKTYGGLSKNNIPWKNCNTKEVLINERLLNFNKNIYLLTDSYNSPIYKCSKASFDILFGDNFKSYDVDIYVFEEDLTSCIVYTGLFDKKIFKLISAP